MRQAVRTVRCIHAGSAFAGVYPVNNTSIIINTTNTTGEAFVVRNECVAEAAASWVTPRFPRLLID